VIPSNEKKADDVRDLFGRLASRYDLMNRLMTGGQDVRWRQTVIRRARLTSGAYLLDLGAGTGDLSREEAVRILEAMREQERELQRERARKPVRSRRVEKDW